VVETTANDSNRHSDKGDIGYDVLQRWIDATQTLITQPDCDGDTDDDA
jgi:hypothetical protein